MTSPTLDFTAAAETGREIVGGKAQNLGKLALAGFRVPSGFVIPAGNGALPEADLETALSGLGAGPFAVRSSGIAEDGVESSLAGQYLSLLNVGGADVDSAITEVKKSNGADQIAVIVQKMIDPVCAGVAFTADPVTGDRQTTIVNATAGLADRLVSGEVAGDEWQVVGRKARLIRAPEEILSRGLAKRVAQQAEDLEDLFGSPQDVEWAFDGKDLWVVQSRPITGLPEQVSWDPPAQGIYDRSLRFGEWIPEPVTPLFESWLVTRMERRIHEFLHDQIGQVAPEPLHVTVNGWYYYSLNWLPVPGVAFGRNFVNIARTLPKVGWRKAAPMLPQTVRFGYQQYEDEWRRELLPGYRQAVSEAEQRVDVLSPLELVRTIDELADLAGFYFASIAVVAGAAYKFEAQLAGFWNKNLRTGLGVSHMVLLQGLDHFAEIAQTPRLETLDWWRAPLPPGRGLPNGERLAARRIEIEQKAEEILKRSPRRLAKFRRLLGDAQHTVPVREEQLSLLGLPWPIMRRAVQRLGEALTASGAIEAVDDVFFLTRSEVTSLLDSPASMEALVNTRREAREGASRLVAPLVVGKVPPLVRFMFSYSGKILGASRSDRVFVSGVPASPGRATGPVRVVRNSSDFDSVEEGDVLVAPLTAPAWADLFGKAAAVVTDVGSAFAHASIIAREYGIPAVVGTGDATARLTDGQMVTVDGSKGTVEPG